MTEHEDLGEEIRHAVEAPPTRIVVVGGGMAGLVVARECARPGFEVTVLEAGERFGGSVAPLELDGLTLDAGAGSLVHHAGDLTRHAIESGATGDSRVGRRRAVGMIAPAEMGAYFLPKPVDAGRKALLASQWRAAVAGNADIRRWQKGDFQGEDHRQIDAILLGACTPDWRPLARVMAELMGRSDGFFVTDFFAYWRARELAAQGHLELGGSPGQHGYGGLTVRLSGR